MTPAEQLEFFREQAELVSPGANGGFLVACLRTRFMAGCGPLSFSQRALSAGGGTADIVGRMAMIPLGLKVERVVYFTLPNAAWDRQPGLHDLDFGLDVTLGDGVVGIVWHQRSERLDIVDGSLRGLLPTAEAMGVSSLPPWEAMIGTRLVEAEFNGPSVLRLAAEGGRPIWVVSGNYLDEMDCLLVSGDSVLVVYDDRLAMTYGLA